MHVIGTVTDKNGWLINNGIYYASRFGKFYSTPTKGQQVVTEAMGIYPYLGQQYFVAAEQIATNYGGIDANGKTVNLDQIEKMARNIICQKHIHLMMGLLSLKREIKLAKKKLNVYIGQQKKYNLNIIVQLVVIIPLESGHADDVLTMVIYNSPDEYQFNRQLYGYETNNGGIYIEGTGTFFTYERTPQQSIYSLEELFRHELHTIYRADTKFRDYGVKEKCIKMNA